MTEKETKLTKEETLKNIKKMYKAHLIDYKQYMLRTKIIEKHWNEMLVDESTITSAEERPDAADKGQIMGLNLQESGTTEE